MTDEHEKQIGPDMVRHVANLARLKIGDDELDMYAQQLNAILDYVRQLDVVPTDGIEPTAHVLPVSDVFRQDEVIPPISNEDAMDNAPDRSNDFFKVPRVLEDPKRKIEAGEGGSLKSGNRG